MNKKAEGTAESIQMMYRLVIVFFIAFIILGTSAVAYGVYINTRDSEAELLLGSLRNCIVKSGEVILDGEMLEYNNSIVKYCGFVNLSNVYVSITINLSGEEIILYQGDSGKKWIYEFFSKNPKEIRLKTYKPGYAKSLVHYPVLYKGNKINSNILMEVIIFDEET